MIGVLHIGHVGGHPGDQAGGAVLVDVGKGEGLYIFIYSFPQVAGQAGRRFRCAPARQNAEHQAQKRPCTSMMPPYQ